MKRLFYLLSTVLLLSSCDAFEYHPYDGRVTGETGINAKNIARIEKATKGKKSIKFALIGDTQRWYDDTKDFVKAANQRTDLDFIIHGGDISDFGLTKEFLWMRDILNKLNQPYVVLLGNHDCLANGEEVFRKVFGHENFAFMAGNTKFVCLNTNALEADYSNPIPDFNFIEEQIFDKNPDQEKTVVAMHARPFDEQFNNNVARVFQKTIKEFPELQFCLHAHNHNLMEEDIFKDGVMYYGTANIAKRVYLVFTLNEDNTYEYEKVEF